jgi:hypothetical protein
MSGKRSGRTIAVTIFMRNTDKRSYESRHVIQQDAYYISKGHQAHPLPLRINGSTSQFRLYVEIIKMQVFVK